MWCSVRFVGGYFSLSTTIEVPDTVGPDDHAAVAVSVAAALLESYYGWQVLPVATTTVVTPLPD
jgi:hypothetical protein